MVNLSKTKTVRSSFFPATWKYHLLLDGRAFEDFLVHDLECHEIHLIRHVRRVLHLGMEIKQSVVCIESAQQVLDAERLAPDMLDMAPVVLVDGLGDKVYQLRRLAAELFQKLPLSVITDMLVSSRKFLTVAFTRMTFSAPSAFPAIRFGDPRST